MRRRWCSSKGWSKCCGRWSTGAGAGTNRAVSSVIIGGQTLALLLTLIGVPVLYAIFDDWAQRPLWRRLLPGARRDHARREGDEELAAARSQVEGGRAAQSMTGH